MNTWIGCFWVAVGGSFGALARFGIANLVRRWSLTTFPLAGFPLGTLGANLLGCFLIGLLFGSSIAEKAPAIKLGAGVVFLGSLTTFSTFSAEVVTQLNEGQWLTALGYTLVSVFAGLLLVFAGMAVANGFRATT